MAPWLLEVRHLPVPFFFLFTWNVEFCKHLLSDLFVINKLRFLGQIFLFRERWVHETASSTRIIGVVNNPSSTKLSYSKWKNAVLNPSKSFLVLKKVSPRILLTFKRSFSKKMGKILSSHIIHFLGDEYCWIVRDSEPIGLLESRRSLSVYKIIRNDIYDKYIINM